MFNPSREQVRHFFTDAWRKHRQAGILTPLESMAVDWILQHPEYHGVLEHPDAVDADFPVEGGQTNPFLHLSMHLAISEQLSIDHPPGIKAAYDQLLATRDAHEAVHEIMECLGEVVWEAQRMGTPFSNDTYLDLIRRRVTRL
ncbi:MAG TPA: DUF1841 family protein [Pusillimonas sp.]|uniref:DUF1841 family protein n=1 Tax=unclassified Pusillimonas TaxID=2640016 RepID=UPI00262967D1|nr:MULTISPECIES: DUF1841 family protein [unclassified Pusillimonas]HLU20287.1 DUF1841 family protein [Pusillimonas sp.]